MRKRILLVDDEKDFVKLVKQRLQANGYKVLAAYNGDQGLKLAKRKTSAGALLRARMSI